MSSRFVNLALLVDSIILIGGGLLLLYTNRPQDAWLYDVHRYAGVLLIVLLAPKARIIARALVRRYKKRNLADLPTLAAVTLVGLLLLSLATALAWTLDRLPFSLPVLSLELTPLALHWYVALGLLPFLAWHIIARWIPLRRHASDWVPAPPRLSRRTALQLLGVASLAAIGFGALDLLAGATPWVRRFTGSRLVSPFQPEGLPVTSSDAEPVVDAQTWRLRVTGRVSRPLELSLEDLLSLPRTARPATLDCTLGWASEQTWEGVTVNELLGRAGLLSGAASVRCTAVTGYYADLQLEETGEALLVTRLGDRPLPPAHGFPARLVVPSRRGYHWVKWMQELVVS